MPLIDSLMIVLGVLLLGSAWMMVSLARRLGRPLPSLRDIRLNRHGWLGRWLSLVCIYLLIKGITALERLWEGVPPWPRWPQDLLLCLPIAAVIALFMPTVATPESKHESSMDDTNLK